MTRGTRSDDLLFWGVDISDVFEHQKKGIRVSIDKISDSKLRSDPRESIIAELFEEFRLDAPVLAEDKAYTSSNDTMVKIGNDRISRLMYDSDEGDSFPGTEFHLHVPIIGDPQFLTFRPSSYSLSPLKGTIKAAEVICSHKAIQPTLQDVKSRFDSWLAAIKKNLNTMNSDCQRFNHDLPNVIDTILGQRLLKVNQTNEILDNLGYAVKPKEATKVLFEPKTTNVQGHYDAFISHAGEDKKSVVDPLANALADMGFKIWYDVFELTIGDSLRKSIDKGLAKSNYGIVVLSKSFLGKGWPEYELDGLLAKEIGNKKVILPIWHDVGRNEILAYSPSMADKFALDSNLGTSQLAAEIAKVLKG